MYRFQHVMSKHTPRLTLTSPLFCFSCSGGGASRWRFALRIPTLQPTHPALQSTWPTSPSFGPQLGSQPATWPPLWPRPAHLRPVPDDFPVGRHTPLHWAQEEAVPNTAAGQRLLWQDERPRRRRTRRQSNSAEPSSLRAEGGAKKGVGASRGRHPGDTRGGRWGGRKRGTRSERTEDTNQRNLPEAGKHAIR